eukprot:CCRYP_007964-RA/>CCRYP_007964-RA protein AED:0.04 eAED:0.04 QI:694/1/1/1/0.6/0.66/6/882/813
MTLRRQYRDRMINVPTAEFKKLRRRIDFLLKKDERKEVYKILCQLRNWEMNPLRNEVFRDANENGEESVNEYVDLTEDIDDKNCIDVDTYMLDVPLVNMKQGNCDESTETKTVLQVVSSSFVQPIRVAVKQEHAEEGTGGKSQTQTEICSNFHPGILERERNSGADEGDGQSTIVSQRLNCSSLEALEEPSEFSHVDAQSNRAVTQVFTPCAERSVEDYILQEVKSIMITVQEENANYFEVTKKELVQVVSMGQVDKRSDATIEEVPFQPDAINPRKISSNKIGDHIANIDEYAKKIAPEILGLSQSRTNNQRKNAKVPTTDIMTRSRMFSLGKLPPPVPQIGTFSRRTKYSPYSMLQRSPSRSSSTRALENTYSSSSAAVSKLHSWHFGPYILALKRREPVSNKLAGSNLPQQSEVNSLVPPCRTKRRYEHDLYQTNLAEGWRKQIKKRRKGEWMPQGHLTGKWKAPQWADGTLPSERKPTTCKKVLLPVLKRLVNEFITSSHSPPSVIDAHLLSTTAHLKDVICPFYLKPTIVVLKSAHHAIQSLLPDGDCESFDVIEVARKYYDYWRPAHGKTKVILLAESHAFTEKDHVINGPRLDDSILTTKRYDGPREFLSLVYCLAYGENDALTSTLPNNKGTPQFWSLLAACSRGVDHVATIGASSKQQTTSLFAADILKGGGLPLEERLNAKLKILEDLRERGIWLLDVSIFGWYISQPQQYHKSSVSNEIQRMTKQRPPHYMKAPSLVLSFELFTKHLIREIAEQGNLQLVIPIGREVEQTITRKRLVDAVRIAESTKPHARVLDAFPAVSRC